MGILSEGSKILGENNDEYELLELIGSGSFGNVFKTKKVNTGEIFAVKILQNSLPLEKDIVTFKREVVAILNLEHKNIIKYLFFNDGEIYKEFPPYLIMEYANEGTLRQFILQKGNSLLNEELTTMIKDLSQGMKILNEKVIHRDIKPENILIFKNNLKITDFGLSKFVEEETRTLTFKGSGTPLYMSPEAWKNERSTLSMDIYSMGIVFFELATGKNPYSYLENKSYEDWKNAHLSKPIQQISDLKPDLSHLLQQLINKMCKKKISERFKDWDEILEFLEKGGSIQEKNLLIKEILQKKIEVDEYNTKKRLEREEKQKINSEKEALVKYQYEEEIIKPLEESIQQINLQIPESEEHIKTEKGYGNYLYYVGNKSNAIKFNFHTVFPDRFTFSETQTNFFEEHFQENVIIIPKYNDKEILGWITVEIENYFSSEEGFTIFLVKEDLESPYGEWYFLKSEPLADNYNYSKIKSRFLDERTLHTTFRSPWVSEDRYQAVITKFEINDLLNLIKTLVDNRRDSN